jgi:DNA repair exonuclease SbcCD ATPase subunit
MYNVQNLYGSIAGINNKIFELENQILQHKSPPPQASNQIDMENKIAQLISTVDALKTNHALFETKLDELRSAINTVDALKKNNALFETQLDELRSAINSKQDIASISLAREVTEPTINSKQDIASISLAMEVTEAVPAPTAVVEPPQVADDVFELVPPKPKGGRKKKT